MSRLRRRGRRALVAGLALLGACACPSLSASRPLQVEDLLRREDLGKAVIDPTQRWLVLERRGPVADAGQFTLDRYDDVARTRLMVVDLPHPGPARPLFRPTKGAGYAVGAFSPDGARVLVYRLTDGGWRLGVARLAERRVRWLDVTPEATPFGKGAQWISNDAVVAIGRPAGDPPFQVRWRRNAALLTPARWAASHRGDAAVTAVGSGRFRDLTPQGPPRRLLRIDVRSGAARTLAIGAFVDLEAAPGGRFVAVAAADGAIPFAADRPVQGAFGMDRLRRRLQVLDLVSGALTQPCPDCDILTSPLAWSPRANTLLVFARRPGQPWTAGRLLRIDPTRGAVQPAGDGAILPELEFRPEIVRAGWLGDDPIVWGRPRATGPSGRLDWHRLGAAGPVALTGGLAHPSTTAVTTATGDLLVAADGAAWRLDGAGGQTRLAVDFTPVRFGRRGDQERTWFDLRGPGGLLGLRHGATGPQALELGGATAQPGPRLPAGAALLAYADRRGALVSLPSSGGAARLQWAPLGGATLTVATLNAGLADLDPVRLRRVTHAGPAGEPLTSWLLLPARPAADGRPPPLIVWPYPGLAYAAGPPSSDLGDAGFNATAALLAGHGFAVLLPSLPLPKDGGDPVQGLADRVLAIVNAAAKDPKLKGAFDPDRLGVWGHSYGGYATLALLSQTARFRAAIAQAGISDLFSLWGEIQPSLRADPREGLNLGFSAGWVEDLQGGMHGPPWSDPQRYLRNSPAFQADRIATPLMLAHGDQDSIPLGQSEEMFSALLRQDKDAVLVTYWGEGHVLSSPGNLRDLYARAFAWFDAYLNGAPFTAAFAPRPRPGPGPASGAPRPRSPSR